MPCGARDCPAAEAQAVAERVIANPHRWKADTLAWRLRLTDAERTALKIKTIGAFDVSKAERLARRKECNRAAEVARRRAKGAKPRATYEAASASRTKPWEAFGISRRTWERRGKPIPPQSEARDASGRTADEASMLSIHLRHPSQASPPQGLVERKAHAGRRTYRTGRDSPTVRRVGP